jgi:hypothetical protein
MEVLWGIILLLVMYVVIPVAIIGATLALLSRRRTPADAHADDARPTR